MSNKADSAFVERVVNLLLPLGPVQPRRMFGGWGLFLDGVMFALIARDRLHLKADRETKDRFAAAGSRPFSYQGRSRPVEMSYWLAPDGSLAAPEALLPWAHLAVEAATRNQARKPRRKGRR